MIAVNPCKNVQIYGNDIRSAYQKKGLVAPHVYAVADAAFDEMMRGQHNNLLFISSLVLFHGVQIVIFWCLHFEFFLYAEEKNQSIIIRYNEAFYSECFFLSNI